MSEKEYPYVHKMNILCDALEKIDVDSVAESCGESWFSQTLCQVNDSLVRMAVMQGEYHWHSHDEEDEFFFTLSGELIVDVEGRDSVHLAELQGFVVPKGVPHRTRAPEKTVILMMETTKIVPNGDE